jgi:hypothetical protein
MLVNDLMKDLDFRDPGRLLQQTARGDNTEVGSAVVGILVIMVGCFGCVIMLLRNRGAPVSTTRVNAMNTPKTTIAAREHAILKLFEISQVTMVSFMKPQSTQK